MINRLLLLALAVCLAAAAACGGGSTPATPLTPRPTQALPTPFPTATPLVVPTPEELTPVPAAKAGRSDCPEGWAVYRDAWLRLSVCYPPTLLAIREQSSGGGAAAIELRAPEDRPVLAQDQVFFLAYWQPRGYANAPGPSYCVMHAQEGEVSHQESTLPVLGLDAPACFTQVNTVAPGVGVTDVLDYFQIVTEVPWPSGGFLTIRVAYRGPDLEASRGTLMRMLATLAVQE